MIFRVVKFPKGRYVTMHRYIKQVRWYIKNQLSMAYSLSNICTKNFWNQTTIVETIIVGWVVSFF